jgi:methylated-DNA-[protein]-cysteine S-methyltransferase
MAEPGYTLFETPIGRCGLVWGEVGLLGVQLPETPPDEAERRLRRRFPLAVPADPPAAMRRVVERIVGLLSGVPDDLHDVPLDHAAIPDFERRVYAVTRKIRPGETLTYGEVAARIGEPGAARAVGRALGRNPFPIIVPCHRVLATGGGIGGFSADGGIATKRRLLRIEGARGYEPGLFD